LQQKECGTGANATMAKTKIYDPESGRTLSLESVISKLGTMAIAKKYGVAESTVYKWRKGIHKPSHKTLSKSLKGFF